MEKLKDLIKSEKKELNERMDKVFVDHGIVFEPYGNEGKPLQTQHIELPDDEDQQDWDPYGQLGYGFEAYFSSMNIFAWVFLVMTILMLPALCYYVKWEGLKSSSHGYYNSMWMLGNFGFNRQICVSDYIELNAHRILGCEIGNMTSLKFTGIIPGDADVNNLDLMPFGYCGNPYDEDNELNKPTSAYTMEACTTDYMEPATKDTVYGTKEETRTLLNQTFIENCWNKTACDFTMKDYVTQTSDLNTCT